MPITRIEFAISAIGIVSECLLLIAWLIRGRQRPFWLVGAYAVYHLSFSVCMRVLHLRRQQLGFAKNIEDYAIDFVILLGVVVEMFAYTIRPLAAWPNKTRLSLTVGLTVGALVPLLFAMSLKFVGLERIRLWMNRLDLATSLLLGTLLLISAWIGIELRVQRSNKISLLRWGLVVWVGTSLIVNLCRVVQGWTDSPVFENIPAVAWVIMIFFWAVAVSQRDGALITDRCPLLSES